MVKNKNIPKITVLVEGENELNYWRSMPFLGTPKIFNLWHAKPAKLNALLRQIKSDEQIIVVADTDELINLDNFIHNISEIKKHCKLSPIILLQCQNFEEELCYSCGCKIKVLLENFNANSLDNFKTNFNKEKRIVKKLEQINHNIDLMWSRSDKEVSIKFPNIKELIFNQETLVRMGVRKF